MYRNTPIIYSNKGLRFWEAGCTWIQDGKAVIQLRKSLEKKERYLGIISKQELLEHEGVHALRLNLEEPRFEEVLAYHTSRSRFRRYMGPFFRSPRESLLFMGVMAIAPFVWLPLALITAVGMIRLIRTQRIFSKALAKRSFEELLLLTDQEIECV